MYLHPDAKQYIVKLSLFFSSKHQGRSAEQIVFEILELVDNASWGKDDAFRKGAGWGRDSYRGLLRFNALFKALPGGLGVRCGYN